MGASRTPAASPPQGLGVGSPAALDMLEAVETGVLGAIGPLADALSMASGEVAAARKKLASLQSSAGELAAIGAGAASRVSALAASTDSLASRSREIAGVIDHAGLRIGEAVSCVRDANSSMTELARAGDAVVGILDAVMAVARQANLLALNATIESARAGEASWEFAIVAHEVKALSMETSRAADSIRALVECLRESAGSSIAAVGRIVSVVEDVQPAFSAVRAAVAGQSAAVSRIARQAKDAAAHAEWMGGRAQEMGAAVADAADGIGEAERITAEAKAIACGFGPRFVAVVRQSEMGDRRRHDRFPADLQAVVRVDGRELVTATVDIGLGGLLLAAVDGLAPQVGSPLDLDIEGMGPVMGFPVAIGTAGVHVSFGTLDAETHGRVARLVAEVEDGYRSPIKVAQDAARRVERTLKQAVRDGALTSDALFDADYRPVPGTEPQQYETAYLQIFEDLLPAILEPLLIADDSRVFCTIVDRNGYTPVHNRKYAHPQRPGEAAWNALHCRNKRMVDDQAGITAARSTRPFLLQSYPRDLGGLTVTIREVDVPIRLFGRHWGGLRVGYRL